MSGALDDVAISIRPQNGPYRAIYMFGVPMLADGIEVTTARLDNGLLSIDLVRPVAEPRIRTIRIDAGKDSAGTGNTIDITARRTHSR